MTDWQKIPDDELDARLSADLRTLTDHAVEADRWSRWQVLSAVRGRIEPRPTHQPRSRLAPVAATGGLAVLLALLVVSAPRFAPGGPTSSPDPTPPSSWSSMNTRDFSEAVAAGGLRGETRVVIGELDFIPLYGLGCRFSDPCPRYSLAGTEPPLIISARAIPAPEGEGDRAEVEGVDWDWWQWPEEPPADLGALLVLSVAGDGQVDYVGWLSEEPMGVNSFAVVDPASMSQSEVHVVPGWLTAVGVRQPMGGAPPPASIAGLPQRWSGARAWLLDRPLRLDPQAYTEPEDGVRVQSSAYERFSGVAPISPISEPVPGLWAVAPRLEGAGCPDNVVPCWRWNLVGRVSYEEASNIAEPVPTPSDAPASPTPSPDQPPTTSPVTDTDTADTSAGTFELSLEAGSGVYVAGQPIDVMASLTLLGSTDDMVHGSGSRLGQLTYYRSDHRLVMTGHLMTLMCSSWTLGRGDPIQTSGHSSRGVPYINDDDPNADFYREWMAGDELWLPPGTWRIAVDADFWLGERCGEGEHVALNAEIWLTVVDQPIELMTAPPSPDGVCPTAQVRGTLVAHPESGLGLRLDDGRVSAVMWPHGSTARRTADGLVLFRAGGSVAAREGDYLLTGGGHYDTYISACSEGDIAEPVAIWTAETPCGLEALVTGYLVPHTESGLGLRYASGFATTSAVMWPPGYRARREHSTIVLVGPDGAIRAREGDLVTFGGGGSRDGPILACDEVTTSRSP